MNGSTRIQPESSLILWTQLKYIFSSFCFEGDLGGTFGLFLGMSCLTLFEFVDFTFRKFVHLAKGDRGKRAVNVEYLIELYNSVDYSQEMLLPLLHKFKCKNYATHSPNAVYVSHSPNAAAFDRSLLEYQKQKLYCMMLEWNRIFPSISEYFRVSKLGQCTTVHMVV